MSLSAHNKPTAKEKAKQRQRIQPDKVRLNKAKSGNARLSQARAALSGLSGAAQFLGTMGHPSQVVTPGRQSIPLGPREVDGNLPGGGIIANALHEVLPNDPRDTPAATSFLGHLAARLLSERSQEMTVWIRPQGILREWGMPYGPGLGSMGLSPAGILFIHPRTDQDALWVIEEAVQAKGVGVVIGEIEGRALDLTASRRIHLAAEKIATPVLLGRAHNCLGSTAALTRWQISARPSVPPEYSETGLGTRRWKADLTRAKGGRPGSFELEWDYATHCFSLAAPLAYRQSGPRLKAANAA